MIPEERRQEEECMSFNNENKATELWGLFSRLVDKGFSQDQAIELMKTRLHSDASMMWLYMMFAKYMEGKK